MTPLPPVSPTLAYANYAAFGEPPLKRNPEMESPGKERSESLGRRLYHPHTLLHTAGSLFSLQDSSSVGAGGLQA